MHKLPLFIFLGLALLLVLMLQHQTLPKAPGSASHEAFPEITVRSFDGTTPWDKHALSGHVTVVNFFASWCAPCAAEMPELAALKKQFPTVRVVGIAWNDERAVLEKWLKKHGNPYDTTWLDPKGDATIALGLRGIPESFLIDRDGQVRYRLSGPLTAEVRNRVFDGQVQTLLDEVARGK